MKKSERLEALSILTTLFQQQTPLSYLFQKQTALSPLTKEICFGVTRHYIRLETIADHLLQKRPKDTAIWLCIIIGLYQLYYLSMPDYAVVKETVALLEHLNKIWAKGLVNAILRRFCREKESILNELKDNPYYQHDHPDWLIKHIQYDWPEHWQAILNANNTHPPMSLRVNQLQLDTKAYLALLDQHEMSGTSFAFAPDGILLNRACTVQALPGFSSGMVSVQDLAAQLAIPLLDLKPGLRVLDACCAPGGKTCHILEKEPNLAECVALDIDATRLTRVQDNLNRLNLKATLLTGDGLKPDMWWDHQPFDRILLDAPCSATGIIRRHSDIKLLRTPAEINTITQLQKKLLITLWPLLKPGGRLVYATCSIMPEENEKQIAYFSETHPDCVVLSMTEPWGHATNHGRQILPGEDHMDGFFYSVLIKNN